MNMLKQTAFTISGLRQQRHRQISDSRKATRSARQPGIRQAGFTIVELMIATMIFSVILLTITYGVLSFTHSYYRGVNNARTQTTARSITDTISQAIQFSGSPISGTNGHPKYFCAGYRLYIFNPGTQYTGGALSLTNPGLYVYTPPAGDCPVPTPAMLSGGTQLLAKNMRVGKLTVEQAAGQSYSVAITVAFGDGDLLCNTSKNNSTGGCNKTDTANNLGATVAGDDIRCRLQTGSEFCAVSTLSTTILRRVSAGS